MTEWLRRPPSRKTRFCRRTHPAAGPLLPGPVTPIGRSGAAGVLQGTQSDRGLKARMSVTSSRTQTVLPSSANPSARTNA